MSSENIKFLMSQEKERAIKPNINLKKLSKRIYLKNRSFHIIKNFYNVRYNFKIQQKTSRKLSPSYQEKMRIENIS